LKIFAAMKILLAAATEMETGPLQQLYLNYRDTYYAGLGISFLTTGIGMLATAVRLSAAVQNSDFDLIIQAGIAGTFDNNLALCGVYRISEDTVADMGVEEDHVWKDVFDMQLVKGNEKPFRNGKLYAPVLAASYLEGIPPATAISVNEISTRLERIKQLRKKYNPALESMEGAALHFIGAEYNIPFIQLRAVSNYIGERDKANWKIKEAITNLNETLSLLLKKLSLEPMGKSVTS